MSHGAAEIKCDDLGILNPSTKGRINKPDVHQAKSTQKVLEDDADDDVLVVEEEDAEEDEDDDCC